MRGKNKRIAGIIALLVVCALGFWGYRALMPITLAEGYMYEDQSRMVYAKLTPEQEQLNVEITLSKLLVEDTVPRLQTETSLFTGTREGDTLTLQPKSASVSGPTGPLQAKLSADGLLITGSLAQGEPQETKLVASTNQAYSDKLAAWTKSVELEAEQKKKVLAEQRAKEEARVAFANKVVRTEKLAADLQESAQYLQEIQFADEIQFSKDQAAELQGLLDELTAYSKQPGLSKMEYDVMAGTLGSMKVLVDGMDAMDSTIAQKKQSMQDLITVLETDIKDTQAVWEEIKANAPDAANREKALQAAIKAGTDAIDQAKQRLAALEKEHGGGKTAANKLYQQAANVLQQTKAKYGF
ncbi:hypothetical protein AV540_06360 [Brevibacillus parabrevis]|uniref:hypothetical protein n=1 Tax=Brevibacillus parabrevis TaxID=54914 RepID=UPI0007ABBFAC|nr:hypothetical protein [Brevibacillus parabrevis]KZE54648.1 hypothetical protein AV540_06360 [Brevibacillus parabrevis]